ncbi:hypothetical protein G3A43_06255 [Paraburkholderia aspalathi]|nr:hypothetical protein [Paraburkholderia aspalathi]MBK3779850.1 hypothetical protein [Paraburkholderia aspalathi]
MDKNELLALCMKHGAVEFPGNGQAEVRISLDALAQVIDTLREVKPGTIVVQAEQIHFGGGISAYPNKVERAARRLAEQMFVAQDEKVSRTASELNSQRDS